ncbi:MAG: hypothetical protein A3C90_04720 [Candidatus Magasanikbacteria bacterium RIFCSPHIGHO2_02_FULL_51_14]|uniref:Glycosyltransferase 2-like domain-containing protein n=1 Tax=Candidatus Magasanikbacteria bacterium RIFCSPHIGHO2_02_FULL_51_14 TaxID=1798683 RepID=A0A1F6MHF2_9BACT|nr:MAG: hypothetical protein A3C90_04720 [Candidatus Magasanikbacteria bacterium RIFCSPHIGHO2_02_FULL_51_14]
MSGLVSIIIPVYNHEQALKKALDSIFQQTYRDVEVIVVDDGSEKELQISDFRLQIEKMRIKFDKQERKGAAAARNRGLAMAKGEYVIFWDADVIGEPKMLEKMYRALQEHPEASFSYSNFYFGWKRFSLQHFNTSTLQHNNYVHSTSLLRRTDAIRWDESLKRFQDWDYWLTLAEQGKKGIWIDEYLFRVTPGGTMSSWLPSFAYKKPWRLLPWISERVMKYEAARKVIVQKHDLDWNTD